MFNLIDEKKRNFINNEYLKNSKLRLSTVKNIKLLSIDMICIQSMNFQKFINNLRDQKLCETYY